MAISATFLANFDQFVGEVTRADVKLRSFEDDSNKVGVALKRMTDGFSGTKIIQDATLMVSSVERVGGVSKLTEAELKRVSATATEAAAKMKAMGIDVPPGIQKIADETKNVNTATSGLIGTVKNLALGFAALFTVRAAFNFVKDVIADASALKDLSQQTHISVEELQILSGAMSEFGVDADTLGKGLFTLSRKIAKGDDSVADALGEMGLSLKEVQGLNGQELFLKIMDGLSTLQGGLRDDTSSEIFGSRLGMAMAGASEGIRGAIETWMRLNHVASTESVDAMDKYDEAIKRASKSLGAMAANMIGPVAEGFNVIANAAEKGAGKWDIFIAMTKDWASSNSVTGASTVHLAALLDGLNQKTTTGAIATKGATEANREHVPSVQAMTKETRLAAEAVEKLNAAWEKANATAVAKMESDVRNAEGMLLMNDAIAAQERALENAEGEWLLYRDAALMATAAIDAELQKEIAAVEDLTIALQGLTIIGQKPGSSLYPDKPSGVTAYGGGGISGGDLSLYGASLKTMQFPGLRTSDVLSPFGGNGAVTIHSTINVSGVFDANAKRQLTEAVSEGLTRSVLQGSKVS